MNELDKLLIGLLFVTVVGSIPLILFISEMRQQEADNQKCMPICEKGINLPNAIVLSAGLFNNKCRCSVLIK